jgi:SAM-dependent methyltransferase
MPEARFDSTQAQEYWRVHYGRRAPVDLAEDADGLNNVCHPGRPMWLNQYYARFQEIVFRKLLAVAPAPAPGAGLRSALDVGCGAGRWCRLLASKGYDVTGVDLQEDLLARNRERMPMLRFVTGSMQDFSSESPFDLVTTVTVLQHNPPADQDGMIANMRRLLRPGGHALVLENVSDQDVHVFANSIEGWTQRFARAGFRRLELRRYDFSPLLRVDRFVALGARSLARGAGLLRGERGAAPIDPGAPVRSAPGALRRVFGAAHDSVLRVCVAADTLVENVLVEANAPLPTVHCGFLFTAV